MNKKDFDKLNDKVDLIERIDDITNYQIYVLIAEYVDNLLKLDGLDSFLKKINLEQNNLESRNLLNSYDKIKLVYEIIISPDEIDYHGRNHSDSIAYIFDFYNIKNLRDAGGRARDLTKLSLKKQDYKFHLLKFHKALGDFLDFSNKEKANEPLTYKSKKIYISRGHGIFTDYETRRPNYPLRSNGKRTDLVWKLEEGAISGTRLAEYQEQSLQTISQEIEEINRLFKKRLGFVDDLIIRQDTTGYKLNDVFNVEFLKE